MFVDASAIVAIINNEPGSDELVRRIEDYPKKRFVSPLVRFEAVTAIARSRSGARLPTPEQLNAAEAIVDGFCEKIEATDISISAAIGRKALDAAKRYGKITGHDADLNFGDCFAYACASAYRSRLVYKGNDFARTDLA